MLMRQMGFRERSLVETSSWFLAGTLGLVRTYLATDMDDIASSEQLNLEAGMDYLTLEQQALLNETKGWISAGDPDRILETGFRALVEGVLRESRKLDQPTAD